MSGAKPGERRGGRKAGVPNKATAEIRTLAREHGPAAIQELARLAKEAQSEQARISACNALLDRAYGRSQASQLIELDLPEPLTLKASPIADNHPRATASGKLTPAEAQSLSSVIEMQRKAIETAELEGRIKRLEQAAAKSRAMTHRFKGRLDRIEQQICPPRIITYSVRYGASEAECEKLIREAAGEMGVGPNDICVGLVRFSDEDLSTPDVDAMPNYWGRNNARRSKKLCPHDKQAKSRQH